MVTMLIGLSVRRSVRNHFAFYALRFLNILNIVDRLIKDEIKKYLQEYIKISKMFLVGFVVRRARNFW